MSIMSKMSKTNILSGISTTSKTHHTSKMSKKR
jgi:hypothetical protein